MRGTRLGLWACLFLPAACSTSPDLPVRHPVEPASDHLRVDPGYRLEASPAPAPGGTPGGGAALEQTEEAEKAAPLSPARPPAPESPPVKPELPLRRESTFEDVLRLQKEVADRHPASEDERLRLALMNAAAGNLEEAERLVSSIRTRSNRLLPYVELYLHRQLGDHKEAARLLARIAEEDRMATGFTIDRAELVSRVRRYRDYTPAESDRVRPGGDVHIYIEPKNFRLQQVADKHTFHLRYEWKLIDDRDREQAVPAWEKASAEEREDRVTSLGSVSEFHQSFHLPLPLNLAAGRYRVKVTVTDVIAGRTDHAFVPILVAPLEKLK
jgi:tetratricopeptide (TPR) repeat protein